MPVNDSWIAATTLAHGVPVVTQDADYVDSTTSPSSRSDRRRGHSAEVERKSLLSRRQWDTIYASAAEGLDVLGNVTAAVASQRLHRRRLKLTDTGPAQGPETPRDPRKGPLTCTFAWCGLVSEGGLEPPRPCGH